VANGFSDLAVAAGFAVRNFEQRMPARELEPGSAKIERERKLATVACEIFVELVKVRSERFPRFLNLNRTRIHLLHPSFEFESHQAFAGSSEKEWADGRRRAPAEQSFHDVVEDSTMFVSSVVPTPQKKPPAFTGG
jgi:hypothetical protein